MARVEDIEADLTLELDGLGITPERFQKAVRAFFGVLTEVTKFVCRDGQAIQWRVQVKAGSNLVGVIPAPGFRPEVVGMIANALHEGIDALEHGVDLPQFFSEGAIRHARDLGEIVATSPQEDVQIRLWVDRRPIALTQETARSTETFIAGQYEDHGSIDGRLQTVSERGAMRFIVYETLSDKGVTCFIGPAQADDAVRSFRKRVEVYGAITYRRDGVPLSIRVEEIVPFPEPQLNHPLISIWRSLS